MKKLQQHVMRLGAIALLLLTVTSQLHSQDKNTVHVSGTVYEQEAGAGIVPLDFASVAFPDYGIGTTTMDEGKYSLKVPVGKSRMTVSFLGKVTIDTLVELHRDAHLDFTLLNEDFHLKDVVVTASANKAGRSTASGISRAAMDHLQATSLHDLMSLLPGGISSEPNLNNAQQINIRQISNTGGADEAINALGTAIIRDGAPVSNNSNLSAANPTVNGGASAIGGGASPSGGMDVRSISTENIESVEIIRGIPSVEYGDLTSGAVIIHSKAGREPLRIKAKANPNVYQVSVGSGYELGKNRGAMNFSADYAYNTKNPTASYMHYQRATAKLMYSNSFFGNKLRSNTSLDFIYGKDERELNPDDERTQTSSQGRDAGFTLNTNGTWNINKGWLQSVRYVLSGTYTDKQSYYETVYSSANAPYSMTTTDGAVLSNFAGQHIYDADGNRITDFSGADALNYAQYLPNSYKGRYDIDSREVNVFAKLTATLFKQSGNVNNRILLGVDFKTDGNVGEGKTFDPSTPPVRNYSNLNSSYRPRPYNDIPFINQFGAFAEENFYWNIGGTHELKLQAGVRFDNASVVGSAVSPRFNATVDVIPSILSLQGGYGITAKMPTLLYLYPENAYYEYINMNELSNENIPESERLFITTTKVYNSENRNLKIARNHKAELGFRVDMGKSNLTVVAFRERLKHGYSLDNTFETFRPFMWNEYTRNADGQIVLGSSLPVLSCYYTPTNNLNVETRGVEFDLNIGRIDAIRTSFQFNGSWMRSKTWSKGYDFYDNSGSAASSRKPVAIYSKDDTKSYRQQFVTSLRATHNMPQIGFVVTLTAQAIWQQSNWKVFGNDSIPVGYIALEDASVHMFDKGQYTTTAQLEADGYGYMLQNPNHSQAVKESYKPYLCFNMNVTKELGERLRVSFFANNMFRSYPRVESKRNPGTYVTLNNRFYFGLELSLTL